MKKSKLMGLFLAGVMLTGLFACTPKTPPSGDGTLPDTPTESAEPQETDKPVTPPIPQDDLSQYECTVRLNSETEGIRILGKRSLESTSQLNSDWTCSGLEFVIDCKGGTLTLRTATEEPCYFRAYVDGEVWNNTDGTPYYQITGTKNLVLPALPAGVHTVRVIKVTGYTLAQAHFYSMTFYGSLLKDQVPADKDLYIEFVGDSICCGWGTIGNHQGLYSDQDGSLAYPYLVAGALDADYSITALSGQGLLMGNPGMTTGYLFGSPLRDNGTEYSFEKKADLVVINIGTNDYGYREQYGITEAAFQDAYLNFLKTVYKKNGENCKIYCLYNTMNDTYSNAILEVCRMLGGEAAGIYTFCMDRTASGHPTVAEQSAYAEKLTAYIGQTKDNEVTQPLGLPSGTLNSTELGTGMEVDYTDSAWKD